MGTGSGLLGKRLAAVGDGWPRTRARVVPVGVTGLGWGGGAWGGKLGDHGGLAGSSWSVDGGTHRGEERSLLMQAAGVRLLCRKRRGDHQVSPGTVGFAACSRRDIEAGAQCRPRSDAPTRPADNVTPENATSSTPRSPQAANTAVRSCVNFHTSESPPPDPVSTPTHRKVYS